MMNGQYNIGDVVLHNWLLTRLLGAGSYGKVFEAKKKDLAGEYTAAVKIIVIPQTKEEISEALSEGMTETAISKYYRNFVEEISKEFTLMSKLKGDSNIVSYEDHEIIPHDDSIGWDIIIRMELLTPFSAILKKRQLSKEDVIRVGIDICRALELCQREKIIHRDIKPDNIFCSRTGSYKLGDFGVARTLDKTSGILSKKGTYNYMAPEVYKEEPYGSTVDIYSLGIVLYRLLNNNRIPFLPDYPNEISHSDRESALIRRMSGEKIPYPANDEGQLAEIVLKACSYHPKDRYADPSEMREALEALSKTEPVEEIEDRTIVNSKYSSRSLLPYRSKRIRTGILALAMLFLAGVSIYHYFRDHRTESRLEEVTEMPISIAVETDKQAVIQASPTQNEMEIQYLEAVSFVNAGEYKKAEELFQSLGEYKDSLEKLSEIRYYIGESILIESTGKKDELAARVYFQLAADAGYPYAVNKLGECAYYGAGWEQNYEKAFTLFKQAADMGVADALYNMGMCYENGNGVEKNSLAAKSYYMKAADNGSEKAVKKLETQEGQ